ncbi:sensor histidine kinase [Facilibium subflavum]|uniref:sensor histidine kinase n=1 Tax=Facilibium subflavum TaxID=2219058 RepID=UPI000E64AC91|nr:HAMP domain-containing sensor histidine kinase [Facilibium subflavum]
MFTGGRLVFVILSAIGITICFIVLYTVGKINSDINLQLHHRALWNLMDIVEYGRAHPDQSLVKLMSKEHLRYMNLDEFYLDLDLSKLPFYTPLINVKDKTGLIAYSDRYGMQKEFSLYIKPNLWLNVAAKPNYNYLLASLSGHIAIMLFLCLTLLFSAFIIYRLYRNITRTYIIADEIGIKPNKSILMSIFDGSYEILNKMHKRIDDLINTRTQIISSISHDLKTPLARINYQLQLLQAEQDVKNKCLQDTKEMQKMINELVDMSRFEDMRKTYLDLDALIDVVVEGYIDQGAHVVYHAPVDSVHIYGNEDAFVRILYNVIGNSLKFATKIEITLQKNKEGILLMVEDNGPGVPDDVNLNELFRRRVQAGNQELSRTEQGSGLGLAIVYELAHQTGGKVKLKNLLPKGFCVEIYWPS